ncbi:MAG: GGDEF domain-containing phosphodiesterase [Steroidobacteraceae bacterium]
MELLPDLALLMRRDGTIIGQLGGAGLTELCSGKSEQAGFKIAWSDATSTLLKQMVRRSTASRKVIESHFEEQGRRFDARVTPQGPDRAIVVIRSFQADARARSFDDTGTHRLGLDRRGFMQRLSDLLSVATLREQPLAVAALLIEGIPDIAQIIAARVSEQLMNLALLRISARLGDGTEAEPRWHLGQIGENTLAMVIETADRDAIERCVTLICNSLREPLAAGEAEFRLTPYVGVELVDGDASASPRHLLDHALSAADEARQAASADISFYSENMQERSLARLDLGRELRQAIAQGNIRFRYYERYELSSERLVAQVGYLRWNHPLRGELGPADFLRIAGSTGLAVMLSRAALELLCKEFAERASRWAPDVRVSFAPLRDHLFHEDFVTDVERLLFDGLIAAEHLELRIAEKTLAARDIRHLRILQRRGVQLVVDQSGSATSSLPTLVRTPLAGLQLDRTWVGALCTDQVARKICGATIGIASSLGITAIAPGIDTQAQRDALLEMGCTQGGGGLFSMPGA